MWSTTGFQETCVSSHGSFNASADITFGAVSGNAATGGSMNGWIHRVAMACLLCDLTGIGSAQAEGGRITFNGAVVVPTCAASNDGAGLMAADSKSVTQQLGCNGKRQAARGDAGGVASYRLSVVSLGSAQTIGNPLLEYFTGYLAPAHVADAKMMTRTYE